MAHLDRAKKMAEFSRIALASASTLWLAFGAGISLAADEPAAPESASRCKATITTPAFNGPIKQNPNPGCLALGDFGDIYFGGVISGYAYAQSNPFPISPYPLPTDRAGRVDFTNVQGYVQKAEGPFQFYVQAGAYAIAALGAVDYRAADQTRLLFGPLPVAYGKIAFSEAWSIQAGRMPTLIGTEAPFTFQNLNISRGLLFNQENTINQGVQLNYSEGPWSLSVAGTDGFYAGQVSWLSGSLAYKLDDQNTVGINGGLNLGRTDVRRQSLRYQFATPQLQQNSGILSVNYTYADGPWTISPYLQFTNVARDNALGIVEGASTYGAAILASYSFTDNLALAGRVEYEEQTGRRSTGVTSLLYGPGSSAWSFTLTPTYTAGRFFLRGEYSRVELAGITRGDTSMGETGTGFGRTGNKTSQDRFMLETGVTF